MFYRKSFENPSLVQRYERIAQVTPLRTSYVSISYNIVSFSLSSGVDIPNGIMFPAEISTAASMLGDIS